ncbi:MAG: hypothetical protein JSR61_13000 [Proteobacteria bacterium]|nr:hypothetical protein [Pseudomonadota bacterium]
MAATPEGRAQQVLEEGKAAPAPDRKPWQTPRFIVSEVVDTQFGSNPPTNDNPYSQLS